MEVEPDQRLERFDQIKSHKSLTVNHLKNIQLNQKLKVSLETDFWNLLQTHEHLQVSICVFRVPVSLSTVLNNSVPTPVLLSAAGIRRFQSPHYYVSETVRNVCGPLDSTKGVSLGLQQ